MPSALDSLRVLPLSPSHPRERLLHQSSANSQALSLFSSVWLTLNQGIWGSSGFLGQRLGRGRN